MKIINPATEEEIADIHEDTQPSVHAKYIRLRQAQPAWAQTDIHERIACIVHFHDLLELEKDELAKTLSTEMGKPLKESYNELKGARARLQFFIDHSEKH